MMSRSPFAILLYLLPLLLLTDNAAAECIEGDCKNGQGSFRYKNGSLYSGDFKNGKRHGVGTYEYESGNRYQGEWHLAKRTGYGTFTFGAGDKDKYIGQFVDGQRHGMGTYYYENGNKYQGEWRNGERHGLGLYTWGAGKSENTQYLGYYSNGDRHGPVTYYYPDGSIRNAYYEEGKLVRKNNSSEKTVTPPEIVSQPLSTEQQQLLEEFGEPPHFELFLVDSEESTTQRNETWYYPALRTSFTFVDGRFAGSGPIEQPLPTTPAPAWRATDLHSQLSPEAVAMQLVGKPPVRLDLESGSLGQEIPDTMVMLFSQGVVFGFSNGKLALASTLPGMQQMAQEARP